MSSKLTKLTTLVRQAYELKDPNRDEWADWLYQDHVFEVADFAHELSDRFGANAELAQAGAMLHDIADSRMSRFDESHDKESLSIARKLLEESGFNADEVRLVVDDAIKYHSCHEGQEPTELEGKILATADGMAHLKSDFYLHACWAKSNQPFDEVKVWVLRKLERDYHEKILFPDVKSELRPDYDRLKAIFSY